METGQATWKVEGWGQATWKRMSVDMETGTGDMEAKGADNMKGEARRHGNRVGENDMEGWGQSSRKGRSGDIETGQTTWKGEGWGQATCKGRLNDMEGEFG